MKKWSDALKWWMDLLKSVISLVFAAGIAILVVSHFEEKQAKAKIEWEQEFLSKATAIRKFSHAKDQYKYSTLAAARERLRGVPTETSDAISEWKYKAYNKLKAARKLLQKSFSNTDQTLFTAFDEELEKVFHTVNAAGLFPHEMIPDKYYVEEEVNKAWDTWRKNNNNTSVPELGHSETGEDWVKFKRKCLDPVMAGFLDSAESIIEAAESDALRSEMGN